MPEYLKVFRVVKCHDVHNLFSNDTAKMCVYVCERERMYTDRHRDKDKTITEKT